MFTSMTAYGALELDSKTLTIMAIVAVSFLALATLSYGLKNDFTVPGAVAQFIGFVLTITLVATWWTTDIDWNTNGPFPIIGGVIIAAIAAVGPQILSRID